MLEHSIIDKLSEINEVYNTCTGREISYFYNKFNFSPPNSYIDYCKKLGFGLLADTIYIDVPMDRRYIHNDNCFDGIISSAPYYNKILLDYIQENERYGLEVGKDYLLSNDKILNTEFFKNLFYFARTDIGHLYYWSIEDIKEGEFPIICVFDYNEVYVVAKNLYEFIEKVFLEDNSEVFFDPVDVSHFTFKSDQNVFI